MTIQLSIIVWTLICFCLLTLILNKLLFKPMLRHMDERRARIEKAAEKKADMENAVREYDNKLKEAEETLRKNEAERAEAAISLSREKSKADIAAAEAESKKRLELAIADIEYEKGELNEKLGKSVDKLAGEFISRLIS